MTPSEAQAAYVKADDEFALHRAQCYVCGNPRTKNRVACLEGDPLRLAAMERRQEWADAVAEERGRD